MAFDSIPLVRHGFEPVQETYQPQPEDLAIESLYTSYEDFKLYQAQRPISLPKSGAGKSSGKGSLVYLLSPNLKSTMELLKTNQIGFRQGTYKSWTGEVVFKGKIGTKSVNMNNRAKIIKTIETDRELSNKFTYYPPNVVATVKNTNKNLIVDLSGWMELFFNRKPPNVAKLCQIFIDLMKKYLVDEDGYEKIILIDLNSWCQSNDCIIMNRKLLNDPLSIFFYTAYYYPEVWAQMPSVRILVANRNAKQCVLFNTKDLTKKSYTSIKNRMKQMKDIEFSIEDETYSNEEMSDAEVKAEIVNDFKLEMKKKLQEEVNGKSTDVPDPFKPVDVTKEIVEDDDFKEYADEEEDENNGRGNSSGGSDDVSESSADVIGDAVDNYVRENPDEIFGDPKGAAAKISSKVKKNIYISSFMPQRSEKEIERIKRLTDSQAVALNTPSIDEVKKKELDKTDFSTNIGLHNPNIGSSKFANFDKNYVEKCLTSDIDNAIGALSQADRKIFVTKKEVVDSSSPMDLKETWIYYLEDETGNKKTIKLDVPKVLDGTYVYLNGGLKIIGHQFVLKPIVKTGPDAVQIVTSYNKVFVYRRGQFDNNTNNVIVFLQKNMGKFQVKPGNYTMINKNYDIPLDFYMMSKYFGNFCIGNIKFFMDIDELLAYVDAHYASKKREINFAKEIPVGIDMKTHELKVLPLDQSYTDELLRCFDQESLNQISKIKRKPRLIVAEMKIFKQFVPVVVFALFCEGFKSVMDKAKIDYRFVDMGEAKKLNSMLWGKMQLEDCVLVWRKKNISISLLMNGLRKCPLENYTAEELESKDTYISLISHFFNDDQKVANTMNQFRDFLIDPKTAEILRDFGYPTDLVQLLLTAVNMLSDSRYLPENNMNNMRIRSSEVIADIAYRLITECYETYRTQTTKKNPFKGFDLKQSALIDGLLRSSESVAKSGKSSRIVTNLVTEASVLNPILEMDKRREVTFKGLGGIQLDRAMTVARRSYDKSMLGTIGITTSPDANVGVVRELTLEPNITSTRGYIDTSNEDDPDKLNAAQLFTFSELSTPIGTNVDDPDRTAIKEGPFAA